MGFGPGFNSILPERMRMRLKKPDEFWNFGYNLGLKLKMSILDFDVGPKPLVVRRLKLGRFGEQKGRDGPGSSWW